MRLRTPLFPGYVFVHLPLNDRSIVLHLPSVVYLVGADGRPAALRAEKIEALKRSLAGGVHAEPHPFLAAGRRVHIEAGPFAGLEGTLERREGKVRVVLPLTFSESQLLWMWK
jgi:transcription antitermination factor NusG